MTRKGGRGSFPSEKGREKSNKGWRNLDNQNNIGFGLVPDIFKTAIEKYGVWPVTVWDCDMGDSILKQLKIEIGDGCSIRQGSGKLGYQSKDKQFTRSGSWNAGGGLSWTKTIKKSARKGCFDNRGKIGDSTYGGKITESIFNPVVAIWILNLYAPESGVVYDPFAGGGTRAIVTAKKGLRYIGVEIRKEEVDAVNERLKNNKVMANILLGDSKNVPQIKDDYADFLITCPPYYNMEMYDGGINDLSMAETYDVFLSGISDCVKESFRILKPKSLSCWVVGLHRDKNGELLTIPHDIVKIHKDNGFIHKEEVILNWNKNTTGALRRVGNFEKGNKFLIRNHEYLEVFIKP